MQSKRKRMRTLVSLSAIHMLSSVYLFSCTLLILLCSSLQFCAATATDSIPTGGSISSIHNQTLISAGEIFELGFFSLPHDGLRRSRYVGIWYYKSLSTVVVWVANRDNPLPDQAAGNLSIRDGNLILSDENETTYFNTSVGGPAYSNRTVTRLDSGNLVFSDDGSGNNLWQSFDYPTDTFLPGMKMNATLNLTSWTSHEDPRIGDFTFKRDGPRIISIWLRSKRHWRSGESGEFISYSEIHPGVERLLANFSNNSKVGRISTSGASDKVHYIPFPDNLTFSSVSDYNYTRLVMNSSGEIQFWKISNSIHIRKDKKKEWNLIWSAPGDNCSVYNFCGQFGSCNSRNRLACKCLPGFKPKSPQHWGYGEFSAGCKRNSEITSNDTFISLKMMKVKEPEENILEAKSEEACKGDCLKNDDCLAYSYVKPGFSRINSNTCWEWNSDLSNLEEEYIRDGPDLYVRVAASDIGSTSRSCETCGTNMIPYPLSTASNCGDPMYFSFNCNTISGQVSFQTLNGKYRVSSINTETHTFVIQVKDDDCKNSGGKVLALEHLSPPFHVTNSCYIDVGTPSSNFLQKVSNEVEIRWDPPPEPVCASSAECTDWPNSSCKAREDKKKRCLCNESYSWDGMNLNCTQGVVRNPKNMQMRTAVIIMAAITVVSLLCSVSYFSYRRGLDRKRRESRERMPGSQAIHIYDTERRVKNFIDSAEFNEDDKKDIDVPFFDLESILAATEYFSEANKLGQGGFGPVYKGKFAGEQEIAVKRLSSHSGQGLEEFKNEVVLIAKLQHRNLVRLLGYCVKGEEKILLYEYMPNKSLDYFIFDRTLCMLLDWNKRFDIILGIARGLLYLHQDSRLRIIHRDLKTGNILLDNEMNPKISDFGLARIVGGKETEANTNRVVGTYGYMSPEYALDGLFSIKSDVFSFGIILLEIVSGKRNTGFYRSRQAFNLLGYAWGLWKEEKALDLMDQALLESCNIGEVLRCIIVGLLCVQEDPSDRPNMSNAVFMLGSETTTLPNPKQPAFVEKKWMSTTPSSSSSKPETHSNFELTISDVEGR